MEQMRREESVFSGFNNVNHQWLVENKKKLCVAGGVVLAIVIFVGGYVTGQAYRHTGDELESVVPDERSAAPVKGIRPIIWDGVCPRAARTCPKSYEGTPPVILVSLDGFRSDYLTRGKSPTLSKLAQCGANAEFLYSVFPTKTFPNHYSIVTGLNPATHGIIDNSIYDTSKRKLFKVGAPEMFEPFWYQRDPIWVTAQQQGKKTASFFWPGTEVKISGMIPTYNRKYQSKLSFDTRVDQILEWLDLPLEQRPSFLTLYVNQPDNAGHWYGPDSNQVNQAITNDDNMITRLVAGLQIRNLTNCVNIVIVSDHGMSSIDCKNVVDIQNYMNVSEVYATMGPFGRLRPRGRRNPAAVSQIVKKLRCRSDKMRVYPKEQLPVRMHFADNDRIEPIFLDMDQRWTVVSKGVKPGDEICSGGAHGYDNLASDMRGIFLAHGPSIKKNITTPAFINTEIYEMLTEIMAIKPNPNNGTRGSLHHLLKNPRPLEPQNEPEPPAVGLVPNEDMEYNYRLYTANCSCSQTQKQSNPEDVTAKNELHVPFGVPYSREDNRTLRLLYNEDYLLAYDAKYRIPMWTSFTLDGKIAASKPEDTCFMGDARIPMPDSPKCGDYNEAIVKRQYILSRPLYPPSFSEAARKEEASYVTNAIPKSLNHTKIIEKKMNEILAKWAAQHGKLNVVMGPAFDLLATGIRPEIGKIMQTHETFGPLVVPTHIFVVATWCEEEVENIKDCKLSSLMTQGFLLPNQPFTQNCESEEGIIGRNVARVVDIENLTGLSFYTALPIYQAVRLRTMMPARPVS